MSALITGQDFPAPALPERPWSCPGGTLVTGAGVDRDVWLAERRRMLCASDMAALFGASNYGDAYTVWLDKTDRAPATPSSDAQERGLMFEGAVIELWAKRFAGFLIEYRRSGLMRSRQLPVAGATVDRLSACSRGRCVIEAKTQMDVTEWGSGDDPEIPVAYQFQGAWQLYVTGRDHVHFVVMGPRWQPLHRVMYRDEELIARMAEVAEQWWAEFVVADVAPPPTHRALDAIKDRYRGTKGATLEIEFGDEAYELFSEASVRREIAVRAETEYKDALAMLQAAIGDVTEVKVDGELVATWRPSVVVDGANADWRKAHPELAAQYAKKKTEVDAKALVADHPELLEDGLRYRRTFTWK